MVVHVLRLYGAVLIGMAWGLAVADRDYNLAIAYLGWGVLGLLMCFTLDLD